MTFSHTPSSNFFLDFYQPKIRLCSPYFRAVLYKMSPKVRIYTSLKKYRLTSEANYPPNHWKYSTENWKSGKWLLDRNVNVKSRNLLFKFKSSILIEVRSYYLVVASEEPLALFSTAFTKQKLLPIKLFYLALRLRTFKMHFCISWWISLWFCTIIYSKEWMNAMKFS